MSTSMTPLALTRKEAADALRISERKVSAMTASGEIPHFYLGRCVRYPLEDLRRWIEHLQKPGSKLVDA